MALLLNRRETTKRKGKKNVSKRQITKQTNSKHIKGTFVRKDNSVRLEPFVTSIDDTAEHGFVHEEIAHPFANEDVDLLGDFDLFDLALNEGDLIGHAICLDDFASLVDDGSAFDGIDVFSASLDCEHREDARAAADVEHDLVLADSGSHDGASVALGTHGVLQHLLVNGEVGVRIEVIIGSSHVLHVQLRGCRSRTVCHFCRHLATTSQAPQQEAETNQSVSQKKAPKKKKKTETIRGFVIIVQ